MCYINTASCDKFKMAYKKCIWEKCKNNSRNVAESGKPVTFNHSQLA